jgi:SP family general alpha glucoside:H+ symporter-like MFS transporter
MGSGTYFLQQAGVATKTASTLNLGMYAVGACGTILSWPLMKVAGRRTLYLYGEIGMVALMLITGILGCLPKTSGTSYGIGALLIIFAGLYDLTVGPVCYSLVAEISSTRMRAKTVVLARNVYNIAGVVINIINPRMLNPTAWNLGAKSAFLWGALGVVGVVWTFFRLPEPKGRTFGELDVLFEDRVPARKFRTTEVDEFKAAERDAQQAALVGGGVVH